MPAILRLIVCMVLAAPFGWLAFAGFPASALGGYILVFAIYWLIQSITEFRRPYDGLLALGLLSFFYTVAVPALAKAH